MTETAERDTVQEQLCARIDELEREKEVLAAQLDRAETDRDEWKAQADGEAMVCSGYRDERDALAADSRDLQLRQSELLTELAVAREREQALAAHVKELEMLLQGAQLVLRWFRDEHPDEDTETDAEFDTQVAVALQSGPTTSLARRDALKQAEVLESLLNEGRHSYDAETIRAFIRNRLNRLRRQAEEAS